MENPYRESRDWEFVDRQLNPKDYPKDRPLKDWPSDLLEIIWDRYVPIGIAAEMIHAEMNARGEGERVAV